MIEPEKFRERSDALSALLRAKLGVRGSGLETRLARAGRRLPRAGRRAARDITGAARRMAHPKLARLNDPARLDAAFDALTAHLKGIDRADRRRHAILSVLAVVVINLILLAFGLAAFLQWQGLV
ncbi:hypothetical protein [Roseovarius salis]|uniref:hypothetical protein n=1 Tax=Roseovarius salis TaxID=3376063 RepID=UPI0037C94858